MTYGQPMTLNNKPKTTQNYFKGNNMKLSIALEWFLNPDHLPIIAGIQTGKYKEVPGNSKE